MTTKNKAQSVPNWPKKPYQAIDGRTGIPFNKIPLLWLTMPYRNLQVRKCAGAFSLHLLEQTVSHNELKLSTAGYSGHLFGSTETFFKFQPRSRGTGIFLHFRAPMDFPRIPKIKKNPLWWPQIDAPSHHTCQIWANNHRQFLLARACAFSNVKTRV